MIVLFDRSPLFVQAAARLSNLGIQVVQQEASALLSSGQFHAVVSPANSFGFMDGGIDAVYSQLFPGIQQTIQGRIAQLGLKTKLGRPFLPIGSAIAVPTRQPQCTWLICAPTMQLPENVQGTINVFFAFSAILYIQQQNPSWRIACPGLGTGVGKMSANAAVEQIEAAILRHNELGQNPNYTSLIAQSNQVELVLIRAPCAQPQNYANTEFYSPP